MILTVTLNPTLDKLYIVDNFEKGEITRVGEVINTPGGKGLNVSKVLSLLGDETVATGFLGGYTGEYLRHLLSKSDVLADFVETDCETRTCINIRTGDEIHTQFLESGNEISSGALEEFLSKYRELVKKASMVVISGSATKGVPLTFYTDLILYAKSQGKKVILDTSNELLRKNIGATPTLIKPNTDELEQLFNRKITDVDDIIASAQKLRGLGIEAVAVSMGEDGAVLVCEQGVYRGIPPKITPVNTVGCGDSMVAGFAHSFLKNAAPEEALRFAIALSAANALSIKSGDFNKEDFCNLYGEVKVYKV